MSSSPDDRIYSEQHIWLLMDANSTEDLHATIGITEYAQSELGDIVFLELPEIDSEYQAGQVCAVVESVKTASDIHVPVDCKIIEINEDLLDSPETLNESPYEDGWICKIQMLEKTAIDSLMNASQYDSETVEV